MTWYTACCPSLGAMDDNYVRHRSPREEAQKRVKELAERLAKRTGGEPRNQLEGSGNGDVISLSVGGDPNEDPGLAARLDEFLELDAIALVLFPPSPSPYRSTRFGEILGSRDLTVQFSGYARPRSQHDEPPRLLVVSRWPRPESGTAPGSFRVVAIMTAYNEQDVIGAAIDRLLADGVEVHVVDNWSTDPTFDIARKRLGRGVVEVERFPEEPTGVYEWGRLLKRVAEIASETSADWHIHHDADEFRTSPWHEIGLREALHHVQELGFNCADHTIVDHRPVADSFEPGQDPLTTLPWFEFGRRPGHFVQVKAWNAPDGEVDLASTGGHRAVFPGARLFPFNFVTHHFPIRSPGHGRRKIFQDRRPRWDPSERNRGWHTQYDEIRNEDSFLWEPEELHFYRAESFAEEFMAERLARVGLEADT